MEQKIAVYTRISTTKQTTLNQRIRLEKYAELQGWESEVFEEMESSDFRLIMHTGPIV